MAKLSIAMMLAIPSKNVLVRLVLYISLIQLVANAAVLGDKKKEKGKAKGLPKGEATVSISQTSSISSSQSPKPTPKSCSSSSKRAPGKTTCSQSDAPWHLERISQKTMIPWKTDFRSEVKVMNFDFTFDATWGSDVIVYVIDTGVDGGHREFKSGQVLPGRTVPRLEKDPKKGNPNKDEPNHGTGVASLIVGQGVGIARSATIFPIKLPNRSKKIDLVQAVEIALSNWAMQKHKNPNLRAIINFSWIVRQDPDLAAVLKSAINDGVHVVHAGNQGVNPCPKEVKQGDIHLVKDLGQTVVGAIGPSLNDKKKIVDRWWDSSNFGSCLDIAAPGIGIFGASSKGGYGQGSGTSASSGIVSGVFAALLSSGSKYRDLSPAKFKKMFKDRMLHIEKLFEL